MVQNFTSKVVINARGDAKKRRNMKGLIKPRRYVMVDHLMEETCKNLEEKMETNSEM
jgi:hypothetical protein